MSELAKVHLADGREVTGRWATLEEWMMPLDKEHPARKELFALRMRLANAMAQIDKLERQNASLHQQFVEQELASNNQPKEKDERPVKNDGLRTGEVLPGKGSDPVGNALDETAGPASSA